MTGVGEIVKRRVFAGQRLSINDSSSSGLYAVVSTKGRILRVTSIRDEAMLLCDFCTRHPHVAFIDEQRGNKL